jgi:hypothetical protein
MKTDNGVYNNDNSFINNLSCRVKLVQKILKPMDMHSSEKRDTSSAATLYDGRSFSSTRR